MIFEVSNTNTCILQIDSFMLAVFSQEARYPTPSALAHEAGFRPPDQVDYGWDGWMRLLRVPRTRPPWFPTGLLPLMLRLCQKFRYPARVVDRRLRPEPGFPELVEIPLRDYQEEAVRRAVHVGRGVVDMPPRGGKTRTMCEIHRRIALPTLWIAPTDRIVRQTHEVLEHFFGRNYACHLEAGNRAETAARHQVVVCTAAMAQGLSEAFLGSREMVVVDEWHHAAAKSYRAFFARCDHVYFRYGMTGTHFRSGEDDMAMHALLSTVLYRVTAQELLDRGLLTPTHVVFLPVLAPQLRGVGSNFVTGHGKHGIHEHEIRNQLAAFAAVTLWTQGRKVVVLVGTKKQGRMIAGFCSVHLPRNRGTEFAAVEFVSTDMARDRQNRILEAFLASSEVKILVGTSLLGEGVDLPQVDALVYARGERAEVSLTQAVYRVCTAVEGKRTSIVVDFADRHNARLMRHSKNRLRVYHAEPTFTVQILQDPHQFAGWLESAL